MTNKSKLNLPTPSRPGILTNVSNERSTSNLLPDIQSPIHSVKYSTNIKPILNDFKTIKKPYKFGKKKMSVNVGMNQTFHT